MMYKKKKILFFVAILYFCFCSAVCAQHAINMTSINMVVFDKNMKDGLKVVEDLYNRTHPTQQVEVNVRIIPWQKAFGIFENDNSFLNYVRENGTPDIIQIPSTWTEHLIHDGFLYDLSRNNLFDPERYMQQVWTCCKNGNSIYAVPWFIDIRFLYYRKDYFDSLHLTSDDLGTWDSFEKTCHKIVNLRLKMDTVPGTGQAVYLTDKGGNVMAKPIAMTASDSGWNAIHNIIAPHYWSSTGGGNISLAINNGKVSIPNAFAGDISFYFSLASNYISQEDWGLSVEEVEDRFVKGIYAMHFSGPFMIDKLKKRWGDRWYDYFGIAQIPAVVDGHYTFIGGARLGIFSRFQPGFHPQPKVLNFLKYLTTDPDAQNRFASETSMLPALQNLTDDAMHNMKFPAILNTSRTYPCDPNWFKIERILPPELLNYTGYKYWFKDKINQLNQPLLRDILFTILGAILGVLFSEVINRLRRGNHG